MTDPFSVQKSEASSLWAKSVYAPYSDGSSSFVSVSVDADGGICAVGNISSSYFPYNFGGGITTIGAYDGSSLIVKYSPE